MWKVRHCPICAANAVQKVRSLAQREGGEPRRGRGQARVHEGRLVRQNGLKIAGRYVPDVVVHLACFGIAMLARSVSHRRSR